MIYRNPKSKSAVHRKNRLFHRLKNIFTYYCNPNEIIFNSNTNYLLMLLTKNTLQKVSLSAFVLFSLFSCSKDADLLSEYVITQNDDIQSFALLADDSFYMAPGENSILMDVLNNDNFNQNSTVKIIETSSPINGSVTINENNTLTYISQVEETVEQNITVEESSTTEETTTVPEEDSFTYTAEVVDVETGTTIKEEARVTVSVTSSDMGELLAFPGAEGFGKFTTGGRGGKVIHVTNLNDNGAGSLREAINTSGSRTIVFDVGGDINITGVGLIISAGLDGDLTIAGETAPFPGITLRGDNSNDGAGALLEIRDSNVIIRYITIRVNDGNKTDQDAMRINVSPSLIENIIIDHVTLSHGSDENFSIDGLDTTNKVNNVTVQNSFIGNSSTVYNILLGNHVYNYSFIGNYLPETTDRNAYIGYGIADEYGEFINNIIYSNSGSLIVFGNHYDLIGNIYKGFVGNNFAYPTITYGANKYNNPNGVESDGALYVADNVSINPPNAGFYASNVTNYAQATRVIIDSEITLWAVGQANIEDRVFNYGTGVGNSIHRELLDLTHINAYFNNTGSFTVPNVPSKMSTSRSDSYDTDNDGMADVWERKVFGDLSKTASDDENKDGYTNLETFLYSLIQ